jgi:hypothetical protein
MGDGIADEKQKTRWWCEAERNVEELFLLADTMKCPGRVLGVD